MINWKNELGVIRPEFGAGVKAFLHRASGWRFLWAVGWR